MALSFVRIENEAVVFRRWPHRAVRIPRSDIERFSVLKKVRSEAFPLVFIGPLEWPRGSYDYVALLMKDGSSIPVPGRGSDPSLLALRLNNELPESR